MISWAYFEVQSEQNEEAETIFHPICIDEAISQRIKREYVCPECFDVVIPKRGVFRQSHFSHYPDSQESCRLRGKHRVSDIHKSIQNKIIEMLGGGDNDSQAERYFPEICRTADVAHFPSQTVYEVQVSHLSPKNAITRTVDYWRIGWKVVWILSSSRYHPKIPSGLREALIYCGIPYYYYEKKRFQNGRIEFFDFLAGSTKEKGGRGKKFPEMKKPLLNMQTLSRKEALPVDRLTSWLQNQRIQQLGFLPETLEMRQKLWPYNLEKDLLFSDIVSSEKKGWYPDRTNWSAFIQKKIRDAWISFLVRL